VDANNEEDGEYRFLVDSTCDGAAAAGFLRTAKEKLPGVTSLWHPTFIDHLELHKLASLRQNIHTVSHPRFDRPVVAKFTEFPWQTPYLEAETAAYQWIDGADIGPRFLGHLTEGEEEVRVIGSVVEYIDEARTAGPQDTMACRDVLKKLHDWESSMGDINKHNFLVRGSGGQCRAPGL